MDAVVFDPHAIDWILTPAGDGYLIALGGQTMTKTQQSVTVGCPVWSNERVALTLMTRQSKTPAGRKVQQAVLARVEIAMMIQSAIDG